MAAPVRGYDRAMKLRRSSRIVAAVVALFSMLFMQLAVASYSCPGGLAPVAADAQCAGMDPAQPNLCKAKAINLAAKQSLDKADVPTVLPFIPLELAGLVLAADWSALPPDATASPPSLARSIAPPIAVEHCCFRN